MEEQVKHNKEQMILEAAEQEFLCKGYEGARTTSIAKAAGVTHAMLHYYFRTKEHLFERIVDEKFRLMSQSMLAVLGDPSLPIVERIKAGISSHFDFVAENPRLPLFVINEIVSRPERYEVLRSRIAKVVVVLFSNLQRDMDEAAERGEVEKVDVRMLLLSIVSLNIFTFVAYPFVEPLMGGLMDDRERFLAFRKAENIKTIMGRLNVSDK